MSILDRIKFDGTQAADSWLIYKWEREDIALGSQLVVGPGQVAVFVKNGEAQDIFTPGTYTLSSGNLPFLRKLIKLPFGGQTPFAAEVYFVNTTAVRDMNWGTKAPIMLEDAKYGLLLSLRAFGSYVVQVCDSRLLLNRLIGSLPLGDGTNNIGINKLFSGMINMKVKDVVAGFVSERKISFLEIAGYYDELAAKLFDRIERDFSDYGLRLTDFYLESATPPKEEFARLQRYKEELALGEQFYTKRRSFDVLEKMADSQIGDYAGVGMGLGAGLMVGNMTNKAMEQIAANISIAGIGEHGALCAACGGSLPAKALFCPHCGAGQAKQEQRFCTACGAELGAAAAFCANCGARVGK